VINRLIVTLLVVLAVSGCGSSHETATAPPTTTTAKPLRPIEIERPTWNGTVTSPFHVAGTASVYEATLVIELRTPGRVLAKRTVTASEGAPGRGTFDATFSAPPGKVVVAAYSPSAVNGEPQHEVDVPITVKP
jgi:Immunoglobulin-like domain of bacterial spore germination